MLLFFEAGCTLSFANFEILYFQKLFWPKSKSPGWLSFLLGNGYFWKLALIRHGLNSTSARFVVHQRTCGPRNLGLIFAGFRSLSQAQGGANSEMKNRNFSALRAARELVSSPTFGSLDVASRTATPISSRRLYQEKIFLWRKFLVVPVYPATVGYQCTEPYRTCIHAAST